MQDPSSSDASEFKLNPDAPAFVPDPSSSDDSEFKLNPDAPEFVPDPSSSDASEFKLNPYAPDPIIQMPTPNYFCQNLEFVHGGGGEMGSNFIYHEDQNTMNIVPDSNVKDPNLNKNTSDLIQKIVKQVEYQFSDANLVFNDLLVKNMNKDPEGNVPMSVLASWKKIKNLGVNNQMLVKALRTSSQLVVSEDGKKVRRKKLFTEKDKEEQMPRSVIRGETLDHDHFDLNSEDDQSPLSQKLESPKIEQVLQQDVGENQNGANKACGRGRGKLTGQVQNNNGLGVLSKTPQGTPKIDHGLCENNIKQGSPGPRKPDGTRGFTMGRGKPLKSLTTTTDLSPVKL